MLLAFSWSWALFLDRYRDDCITCNFDNFPIITDKIYPPSLSLTQENDNNLSATVLDMDDHTNSFITKVYRKTDDFPFDVISLPFLESNISGRICYLFFYGQVLRYQRLCSNRLDFEVSTGLLARTLLLRNYKEGKLRREFRRVVYKKWTVPIDMKNWFNLTLRPILIFPQCLSSIPINIAWS
jgi:hypothetical protein